MMENNDKEKRELKFSSIAYYLIIGVISILVTGFIPMLSSEINLQWNVPNTTVGWIVWSMSKLCVAIVNMLLFYCFMQQAKVNVKSNERFIKAREILHKAIKEKKYEPKNPGAWQTKEYLTKGTTTFLCSMLSAVGLGQAVLTFDLVTFLSMLFTIIMGVIFGYLQMRKAEDYWTGEFYEYALMVENDIKLKENEEKSQNDGDKQGNL